jgi:phosphatidylinositol alpha-1,6-mannosyltransferase
MTALLLTEIFPPRIGGSSRWFWELYRRLPRAGIVIAAGDCPAAAAFDRTHDLPVRRLRLPAGNDGIFDPRGWLDYRRGGVAVRAMIGRAAVRRMHCGRVLPEGWLALRSGLPFGCYVHGEELTAAQTSRQLTWMARRVLRRATLLIANSRHTADLLERDWRVPASRVVVLTPGVDIARFVPAGRDETVRAAFGWRDRLVVLTVARLQKRKGQDRMIEAIATLRSRLPSVLYAVVGDGEERAALRDQVDRAGLADRVQFLGALDDVSLVRAYQQCDLFVLPNRATDGDFEGFGMVLLEAQACGRAVLAGASGGTREALREGETGVLVDCADAGLLAEAVAALLSDEARRQRMGAAGRRLTEAVFDFDQLAAKAVPLLEQIAPR